MAPKRNGGFVCTFLWQGFGTLDLDVHDNIKETIFSNKPNMTDENHICFNDAKCSPDGRFFAGQKDDLIANSPEDTQENLQHVGKFNEPGSEALIPQLYRLDSE